MNGLLRYVILWLPIECDSDQNAQHAVEQLNRPNKSAVIRNTISRKNNFGAELDPSVNYMSLLENVNPIVRDASDLPSRQRFKSPSSTNSLGLLTSTIPESAYTLDPLSPPSDLGNSDDDDAVEPIDEQEIYGI